MLKLFLSSLIVATLSAQIPYPAIGPDVTSGNGPGGFSYDIPAGQCFRMTPIDTSWNGTPVAVTGATWTSGVVTITFTATPFNETSIITIAGMNPATYNGTYGLGSKSSSVVPFTPATGPKTSLSFLMPTDPGSFVSGGTVQFTPQIISFDATNCYNDLTLPQTSNPSPWAPILHANRAIDWSTAGASSIDEVRAKCGSTLTPSGGDDGAAINLAIKNCNPGGATPGKYVLLGTGTFHVANGITFGVPKSTGVSAAQYNNVTLRGSGPLLTTIVFTGSDGCSGVFTDICVNNSARLGSGSASLFPGSGSSSTGQGANAADWTPFSGYTKGTTTLTLSKVISGLATSSGSLVNTLILDQPNDEFPINPGPRSSGASCLDYLNHAIPCGATESGNTVTINTTVPHNLAVSQNVWVDNVSYFNIAGPDVNGPGLGGLSKSGSTVTVITGSKTTTTANTFIVGNTVCISTAAAGYSGHHTITAILTSSSFTYDDGNSTPLAGGGWGVVDTCYSNSATGGTPYVITAVPTFTSFTFTHPLSGLADSGQKVSSTGAIQGYPATTSGDPGGMYLCQTGGICRASSGGQGTEGRSYNGMIRAQAQMVKVTNVSGTTITTSPGLYAINWGNYNKTSANGRVPGVYWVGAMITGVGIENMTLDHTGSVHSGSVGIKFSNSYNCWVKNVRSIYANVSHVRMIQSSHITVAHSYFYGVNHNSHTGSYGLDAQITTGNLYINNIFNHVAAPMTVGQDTGSVYAYNYSIRPYSSAANYLTLGTSMHDTASMFLLDEGNDFIGIKGDFIHGTFALSTFFRNRLAGTGINLFNGLSVSNTTLSTIPIYIFGQSKYFNAIGNVLGTPGYHQTYESSVAAGADPTSNVNQAIYALGWGSASNGCTSMPCNAKVSTTLVRWGNYDTVNAAVRWNDNGIEIPTGDPDFPNAVPANHTIPSSFFLAAQPGFWTLTSPAPPRITSTSVPSVTVSIPYTTTLTVSGGTGPFTWNVILGLLPPGLSLNSSTGVISGTATSVLNTTATIQVVDANSRADSISLPISFTSAGGALTITTTSPLPDGTQDTDYSVNIVVTGGTYITGGTYAWSRSAGTLPAGLGLNTVTGEISGIPTAAGVYTFTIHVTDGAAGSVSTAYTLTINGPAGGAPPTISTSSLTSAQIGVPYSFQLVGIDGLAPYTWGISAGSLSSDFALDPVTGIIRGTPLTASVSTFTVLLTDSNGNTDTADLTLTALDNRSIKQGNWKGVLIQ